MAGYSWLHGKSNNAVRAEDDGKMVASKFAAWARQWKRFRGCTASDVAAALIPSEWHHTSKFFNRVNYYDPADLLQADTRENLARVIRARQLFERTFKKHAVNGAFTVVQHDGSRREITPRSTKSKAATSTDKAWLHRILRNDLAAILTMLECGSIPPEGVNSDAVLKRHGC